MNKIPPLYPYQQKLEDNVLREWKSGKKRLFVQLGTGGGKCLGIDTPVIMFDGSIKKVQDVIVGDFLMGDDSTKRTVKSTCKGNEELFRVTPIKGDSFVCNGSHIIPLVCNADTSIYKKNDIIEVSIDDYLKWTATQKWCAKLYMTGVEFEKKETNLDPWLLGLWLAEGTKTNGNPSFTINSNDKEIFDELSKYNPKIFDDYHGHNCKTVSITTIGAAKNPFRNEFRRCIFNGDHHDIGIPENYKINDRDSRLQLLAGLLDGDGYAHHSGFEITSKFDRLSEDIIFVARSLGFRANHSIKYVIGNAYHRICITGDVHNIPTKLKRKKVDKISKIKDHRRSGFNVEPIGKGDYYGFEIDGNRRFLLGDFTVTHNTFIFSDIANKTLKKKNKVLIVTHRDELLTQAGGTLERFGLNPTLITSQTKHVPSGNGLYVSMIETLVNRLKKEEWQEWYKDINLLICDEGHLQDFNKLLENPLTREKYVLGFSATPKRTGHQRQLSEDYEDMICGPDVQTLINMGYLVPDRYFGVPIDLKGVHLDKGEYNTEELFDKYNKKELYAGVIDNWKRICPDTITIVFCVNVQHTINTCKAFNDAGIKAKFLVSEVAKPKPSPTTDANNMLNSTKQDEYQNYLDNFTAFSGKRKDVIDGFKRGDFRVLVNCGIATTGFDYPAIQTCVINRATTSENLMLQMIGRSARIFPDKEFFNLLDFGENCKRLGYYRQEREYSLTHEESSKKGEGVAGVKTCPKCQALLNTSTMMCKYCGYVFEKTQEQKIVELVEIKYSEAKQELKTIKDYETYCRAKDYNKNWLFRQIFVKWGKDGLVEYQRTHNLNPSWVYIIMARFRAQGIK